MTEPEGLDAPGLSVSLEWGRLCVLAPNLDCGRWAAEHLDPSGIETTPPHRRRGDAYSIRSIEVGWSLPELLNVVWQMKSAGATARLATGMTVSAAQSGATILAGLSGHDLTTTAAFDHPTGNYRQVVEHLRAVAGWASVGDPVTIPARAGRQRTITVVALDSPARVGDGTLGLRGTDILTDWPVRSQATLAKVA